MVVQWDSLQTDKISTQSSLGAKQRSEAMAALGLLEDQIDEDSSPKLLGQRSQRCPHLNGSFKSLLLGRQDWNNVNPLNVLRVLGFCGPEAHRLLGLEWGAGLRLEDSLWPITLGLRLESELCTLHHGCSHLFPSGHPPLIKKNALPTLPLIRQSYHLRIIKGNRPEPRETEGKKWGALAST